MMTISLSRWKRKCGRAYALVLVGQRVLAFESHPLDALYLDD